MKSERFELALELIRPTEWKLFEDLASKFLAAEFSNLRTLASQSGDAGRDAILFNPEDDPSVILQYSVAEDWADKIRKTAKKIRENFPGASALVYATNQLIGAKADALKKELRQKLNLHLDIRDRSWFVERLHADRQREVAAEVLAEKTVDRYLATTDAISTKALALTSTEARAAFVYLKLQWEDDARDKGLTRLCFESLVRAVLRDTTPEKRIDRVTILSRVRSLLPSHGEESINAHVDSALNRLTKRAVRHYGAQDEFCLSYEERVRLGERLAEFERSSQVFQEELHRTTREIGGYLDVTDDAQVADLVNRVRRVYERFLLGRGEQFVAAVKSGDLSLMGLDNLRDLVLSDLSTNQDRTKVGANLVKIVSQAVESIVVEPGEGSREFVRSLADTYTLFAFMRETPDVQGAIVKMFADGEIWLDASIVLPLLAEQLLDSAHRRFSNMLVAALEAGLKFYMTAGVLEEVERHINRSVVCNRTKAQDWRGPVPFLYAVYASVGMPLTDFGRWVEEFYGAARPLDDIAEYLAEMFKIKLDSLEKEAARAGTDLRGAVQEIWHEAKERGRQAHRRELDPLTAQRLVAHDVENYLGVIGRRKEQLTSPFGYMSWWLTLDRTAFEVHDALKQRLGYRPPDTPVLSPDFLVNYIAFGPVRARVSKQVEAQLPVAMDVVISDFLPTELLEVSNKARAESTGLPERVIRRRIRDALDALRARKGPLAEGGIGGLERDIKESAGGGPARGE